MRTAKLFQNGISQAVNLPEEFNFAGDEVYIQKSGYVVYLYPKTEEWETHLEGLYGFADDFLPEGRPEQGEFEKREELL